jgi:hypothetical protein
MKKQIEITRQSTETIDVEVPSYYDNHGMYVAITDHAVIKVAKDGLFANFWSADKPDYYSEAVVDALKWSPPTITEQEFDIAFHNTIKCLTEQYQLSKSMYDPNTAQQEQANQEVAEQVAAGETVQAEATNEAATESAAQDQAMGVDAEEGSAEG